eukprot:4267653-Pleurochrysis_carterae.AAC.1
MERRGEREVQAPEMSRWRGVRRPMARSDSRMAVMPCRSRISRKTHRPASSSSRLGPDLHLKSRCRTPCADRLGSP